MLPPIADWLDADHYAALQGLDPAEWAWQFLRRHPDYRADYAWFIARWRALEAAYGVPPQRDLAAWKRDPRAYAPEAQVEEGAIGCVAENGRTLVECWLGAKWGFYKFPVDPQQAHPAIPETLLWRDPESYTPPTLQAAPPRDPAQLALLFDLEQPLKAQLEAARRTLVLARRALAAQAGRRFGLEGEWRAQLRLLDGQAAGVEASRLRAGLGLTGEAYAACDAAAQAQLAGGYRQLARRHWA